MEGAFRMEREELDRFCSVGEAVMFYEPGGLPEMVSGEVGYGCLLAYLGSADIRRIGSTDLFIGYDSSQGMKVGKYRFFIRGRCFIFARNRDSGLRAITISEACWLCHYLWLRTSRRRCQGQVEYVLHIESQSEEKE